MTPERLTQLRSQAEFFTGASANECLDEIERLDSIVAIQQKQIERLIEARNIELRDFFAAHVAIQQWEIEKFHFREPTELDLIKWESQLRYLKADAMLIARNSKYEPKTEIENEAAAPGS